jgi:hypothetical protein
VRRAAARSIACAEDRINSAFLDGVLLPAPYKQPGAPHSSLGMYRHMYRLYLAMAQQASLLQPACCTCWTCARAGRTLRASPRPGVTRGTAPPSVTVQAVTVSLQGSYNSQHSAQAHVAAYSVRHARSRLDHHSTPACAGSPTPRMQPSCAASHPPSGSGWRNTPFSKKDPL